MVVEEEQGEAVGAVATASRGSGGSSTPVRSCMLFQYSSGGFERMRIS